MRRSLVFLKNAVLRFGQIGAIWPSSRFLARAMVPREMHRGPESVVVEIGAGTGSLTEPIASVLHPDARLFLVECNPEFTPFLRERFPNATVIEGDAQHLRELLADHGVDRVSAVVSGLPFTVFPETVCRNILGEIRALLEPSGEMIMFQYIHSRLLPGGKRFYRMLLEMFPEIATRRVFLNMPSANVYRLSAQRSDRLLPAT